MYVKKKELRSFFPLLSLPSCQTVVQLLFKNWKGLGKVAHGETLERPLGTHHDQLV